MFHIYDKLTDWRIMKLAFSHASLLLGRSLRGHPDADVLARTVMSMFDRGIRDPLVIVTMTAEHTRGSPIQDVLTKRNNDKPLASLPEPGFGP
ncbi:MAG TPA: hypothetical protein VK638_32995 [Edaphobacter sp.]|nr:hypothetical protein [Edaphobacter sp.]